MKITRKIIYSLFIPILALSLVFTVGCGDDEVDGCTDSQATNYNPDATNNTGCVYARDKFIGNYVGSNICANLTVFSSADLTFDIAAVDLENVENVVITLNLAFPISLGGAVNGNSLTINADNLGPFPIPEFGGLPLFICAEGTATFNESTQTLSGPFTVTGKDPTTGAIAATDGCTITGVKQ